MLQPNLSIEIAISTNSQNRLPATQSKPGMQHSSPVKIRFAAVTSASLGSSKEAVQSE
jgi:hypothetical protein